jgi:diguanylate cyclase (GGDEF)-like protein
MDLDRFKPVNDTLGHAAGDLVLQEVALRLKSAVRRGDTVARVGGDEFVVVLQKMNSADIVKGIVVSLLDALRAPMQIAGHSISLGASIGCACYPQDGRDITTLLSHADAAMYCAKRSELGYYFYKPTDVATANPNSKEV